MAETIFALSSGSPPAGIGVIRISGPQAGAALQSLVGSLPEPRHARYAILRDHAGDQLDRAMILWLPGPGTATGEHMAELHCHGGRAVVAAVETALSGMAGMRRATPGEFTRRAFVNGKIDLAEAEGLADLLSAETEMQRRSALAMAGGALSGVVADWRVRLLTASAAVEAVLDFSDEDDVALPLDFHHQLDALYREIGAWLGRPRAELLREGFRVVLAGPPNAGKSTLFNALVEADAAITAPIAGTTRDILTRPVALAGVPFVFVDTAGLTDSSGDAIEVIGIERARSEAARADLVLWLGPEGEGPSGAWEVEAQIDRDHLEKPCARHRLSAVTGQGVDALREDLVDMARRAMPAPGEAALSTRQHGILSQAYEALGHAVEASDPLIGAENLRLARVAFDSLLGNTTTEQMLDTLFGRFCIGK